MPPIIQIRNLSKRYQLGKIGARTLRDELDNLWHRLRKGGAPAPLRGTPESRHGAARKASSASAGVFWALDDVSLSIEPGETVGIIGRNGAGKSTLLKILSRITEPTTGEAELLGRVSSLLEVGTGFHPELSGRENIYLNGAILGMRQAEVRAKFDEIVAFAEVEKFLDTPVKRYSSGMYVRLAFAVAAHLEPEILIVDEVLAVGDSSFQQKCLNKMEDVAKEGRTVLFVSHRTASIQALCTRAIWLENGKVKADGDSESVVSDYLASLMTDSGGVATSVCGNIEIESVRLRNSEGEATHLFRPGEPLTVEINYHAHQPVRGPYLWLGVMGKSGFLFASQMALDGFRPERLEGRGTISCVFDELPLLPKQKFVIQFAGQRDDGRTPLFRKSDVAHFSTSGTAADLGFTAPQAERVAESASAAVIVPYTWHFPDGQSHSVNPFLLRRPSLQTQPTYE